VPAASQGQDGIVNFHLAGEWKMATRPPLRIAREVHRDVSIIRTRESSPIFVLRVSAVHFDCVRTGVAFDAVQRRAIRREYKQRQEYSGF
jgi:hypothetical protein